MKHRRTSASRSAICHASLFSFALLLLLLCVATTRAQTVTDTLPAPDIAAPQSSSSQQSEDPEPIKDNSFLIEEAYNQEPGTTQEVSRFRLTRDGLRYTLSQDFPLWSKRHQFTYEVPLFRSSDPTQGRGIGDISLSYRYQLVDRESVAVAPRATLILPTGNESEQFGTEQLGKGGFGFEFNIPVSTKLGRHFVTHSNFGATFTPRARSTTGERASTQDFFAGQSLVWLLHPKFNLLVEGLYEDEEQVIGTNQTERDHSFTINPGARVAIDLPGNFQIVPGLSVPVGLGPSRDERAVLFYLSFEHPFQRGTK